MAHVAAARRAGTRAMAAATIFWIVAIIGGVLWSWAVCGLLVAVIAALAAVV